MLASCGKKGRKQFTSLCYDILQNRTEQKIRQNNRRQEKRREKEEKKREGS
jgi:hypothetical protein